MSLPPKAVPKSAAAAVVTGPGTGSSPSSQLRATLTSVSLLPGAPQPNAAPPPPVLLNAPLTRITRVQSLEERIFPTQPGVTTVYSVPRHTGSPYTTHDIAKGHPNLAATPPGHASTPGLSQVSVATAHLCRFRKGWETGAGSPYTSGQNAGSATLVYAPQAQQMNTQPQNRPFFQRAALQGARAAIPSNSLSIRPGSQTPGGAAMYPPNQPIMMAMTPMSLPSTQYYISQQYRHSTPYVAPPQQYHHSTPFVRPPHPQQYRHSTPYVNPPQQYSTQPPGPGTFYPGPGPGEFPTPFATPQYYPGQTVYPPTPSIIVPTPQQPPPAKREKKPIRIRDPNQGGKDITEEIMLGGGTGSRNSTPPMVRPSSTPTPPTGQPSSIPTPPMGRPSSTPSQPTGRPPSTLSPPQLSSHVLNHSHALSHALYILATPPLPACVFTDSKPGPDDKPKLKSAVLKSSSSGLQLPEPSTPLPLNSPMALALSAGESQPAPCHTPTQEPEQAWHQPPPQPEDQDSEGSHTVKGTHAGPAVNGLADGDLGPMDSPPPSPLPLDPQELQLPTPPAPKECPEPVQDDVDVKANEQVEPQQGADSRTSPSTALIADGGPQPLLNEGRAPAEVLLEQRVVAPREEDNDVEEEGPVQEEPLEVEQDLIPKENGEAELEAEAEPVRNGAGTASGTENSDSVVTAERRESSTEGSLFLLQEDSTDAHRKRQYDRDFLLGFQFTPACVQKPEGLPPISDVVLDKINQNKLPSRAMDSRVISRGPDFTPAFADFGRQISTGRAGALMNVGVRRVQPRKIIMNVSVNDVQLKKAENAWKPGMKREGPGDDPETKKTQELFRKVRSILNKLTPQMFEQLMKQVTDLTIDTEERLKCVIDLVFEKAIDEPSFSVAYGNMCRCLATLKVPMADKPNTTVNFRKLLLNRCQKEFERDKVDDVVFERKQKELESATSSSERERLQEELVEAKDKARRRSIGNIKFIGELFKLKMLTEAIMHDCVVKLLKNHDTESLECLCRLLTTIGKDLDFHRAKPRMDQYFHQMEKIVKERKTSSRIRFMLQDVIDLRLHNWVSRRGDQGPKTIEQIHKEAKIEEQEEQRKVHQQLLSKDNKRRTEQREPREAREPRPQHEETWSTVPMTKNSRTIDPTKIPRISKSTIDDKIQLGPRAQLNWMKGSSGGAKASDADLSHAGGSSLNRYCALQSSSPQMPTPPPLAPLSSSTGRERSDKPASSAPTRPGPFTRGSTEAPCRDTPNTTLREAELECAKAREPVKAEAPDRPVMSEEEMERKSKSIIDEFLHITDFKEAVQCVEELDQVSQLHVFVRVGVESTLERSQTTREHIGQLCFLLLQRRLLPNDQFFKGFSETLELADDMAIDIPHIWLYLAELLAPILKEGGLSLKELFSEFSKPLLPVGRAGVLFSEILHLLCKQMSHRKVGALWAESGLSWEALLPQGEDVDSFICQQKLEFVVPGGCSPSTAVPQQLSGELERLLEDQASDEHVFDWVEANLDEVQMSSPLFLRALMTTVCKAAVKGDSASYRVDSATIQRRLPVLLKYLNSDTERQLQALYALQALIVSLDQPPNLLRMFFDCLYDEDVISEDAFYKWESSKDPGEQQGKGVALKSVTAFFTWLREAEEESEDN
ncbi:hypothetical protein SKAU_G00169920 [Synaphobranchus kaupii]|uniref:Eukaryotic translation initiation factor 4 gamma 3 n=1 Tax=Synaphobranchus kaupii TaxID=118154 RepID=A0A9Q1J0R1_SYNKA|nr:hypothetical protein SKAU_G00169920 [Synaphobranchus kaupii]